MDLNEVAVFLEVVRSGSFTRAAERLGMPKSTVSFKVSSLEARLGVTLLQRTTRKLSVTSPGQDYYRSCLRGLEEIKAAEEALSAGQAEAQGRFRLTAPRELGVRVLPDLLARFRRAHPKVEVDVFLTDRRVDLIEEDIDVALRAGALSDSSLKSRKIGAVYFAAFASAKYLKERGSPKQPAELKGHRFLVFSPVAESEWRLSGPKGNVKVPLQDRLLTNDLEMTRALALEGEGIALLPTFYCYEDLQRGRLQHLLPDWKTATTPVHLVYPGQKFPSPALRSFLDLASVDLKEKLQGFQI